MGILAHASPMMQDMFLKTPVEAAVVLRPGVEEADGPILRFFWAALSGYTG